jgi:hypothetical protein
MITVTGPLRIWTGADGSSHFMTVPGDICDEIRAHALAVRRGFGSVRVEARIGEVVWRTSVFPVKSGGYFLPIKVAVMREAGLAVGDDVTVVLELLG